MKIKNNFILLILILSASLSMNAREIVSFNSNWKFYLGEAENAQTVDFDDSGWTDVSIPHDWAISGPFDHNLPANTGKLPWKGIGWYRKHFEMKPEQTGQQIYLIIDGIMAFPKVYINGQFAGEWDYGYNSFYLNITELVNFTGPNVLAIRADTREHDSRWYPGAGIYRKIQMLIADPVHVNVWGTYITTPAINKEQAEIQIITTINNFSNAEEIVTIENQILDQEGNVLTQKITDQKIPVNSSLMSFKRLTLDKSENLGC